MAISDWVVPGEDCQFFHESQNENYNSMLTTHCRIKLMPKCHRSKLRAMTYQTELDPCYMIRSDIKCGERYTSEVQKID